MQKVQTSSKSPGTGDVRKHALKWALVVAALCMITVFVAVVAMATGPSQVGADRVLAIMLSKLPVVGDQVTRDWSAGEENIVLMIRLPRVLLGLLVGASLGLAGVTTQGIFKNPMADPYILGVSSGAAFGAAVVFIIGISASFLLVGVTIGAFAGALAASFIVFSIARTGSRLPVETLLLSGIAVSAFFSAITSFLMYVSGKHLSQIVFWVMGALWNSGWDDTVILFPFLVVAAGVIYAYARDLNMMLLGDETASHLGSDVPRVKTVLLVTSTLLAAAAVSVSGIIGFVGLIIPHIMRLIVGPDHRVLIPASLLVGAMFLVLADTFSRTIVQPTEMPVGIVTAVIGAPFFIYLLIRKKREVG